MAYINKD